MKNNGKRELFLVVENNLHQFSSSFVFLSTINKQKKSY